MSSSLIPPSDATTPMRAPSPRHPDRPAAALATVAATAFGAHALTGVAGAAPDTWRVGVAIALLALAPGLAIGHRVWRRAARAAGYVVGLGAVAAVSRYAVLDAPGAIGATLAWAVTGGALVAMVHRIGWVGDDPANTPDGARQR